MFSFLYNKLERPFCHASSAFHVCRASCASEDIGIRTESDLLFSDTPLEIFSRLPTGITSLEELESFIDLVTELCAAPGVSALELSGVEAQARVQDKELCSGNDDVDRLLRGLGSRKLIQISGDRGSGKSVRSPRCIC